MSRSENWVGELVTTIVPSLTEIPESAREKMREGPFDADKHRMFLSSIPALRQIEIGGAIRPVGHDKGSLRVAAWNVERLTHIDPITDTLKRLGPAATLLSEVDQGMARSGNSHRVRELRPRAHAPVTHDDRRPLRTPVGGTVQQSGEVGEGCVSA